MYYSLENAKIKTALSVLSSDKFNIVACPAFHISPVEKVRQLKMDFTQGVNADYLVFTSQNAVIETIKHFDSLGINQSKLRSMKIYAVGTSVAQQLAEFGLPTDRITQT